MGYLANRVFNSIHSNKLIYNTCWEDPRCDRQLLNLNASSTVVMLTSAGCNALDYSLDGTAAIHCVDMNPRQNALLELKKAAFTEGSFFDLEKLFARGTHERADALYQTRLRTALPEYARQFWDKNMDYFSGRGLRSSFYHHGTAGLFAWLFTSYMKIQPKNRELVQALFESQSIDNQIEKYNILEQRVLNPFVEWLLKQHLVMCLLGIPQSQQKLLKDPNNSDTTEGVLGFVKHCFQHVFTSLPIRDNYFWQLYFYGQYTDYARPNYLLAKNFSTIQEQTKSITTHTNTLSGFLKENPAAYSHFVLLDHQDWLAANDRTALAEEWELILKNSQQGTKILLRSAAFEVDFFPNFVFDKVHFDTDKARFSQQNDRVGTYGSTYLGIVK